MDEIEISGLPQLNALVASDLFHIKSGPADFRLTYETLLDELGLVFFTQTDSDDRYLQQSNNLLDLASIPAARSNLGLGTAALLNEGFTPSDVLSLQTIIDNIGVGGDTPNLTDEFISQDFDDVTPRTLFGTISGNWTNGPLNGGALLSYTGQLIVLRRSFASARVLQILWDRGVFHYRVGDDDGLGNIVFQSWFEVYSTENLSVFTQTESDDRYLQRSNNLSDVDSEEFSRLNIGAIGETEGNTLYLRRDGNLSDVDSASAARFNLDVRSTGESDAVYLNTDQNFADLGSTSAARSNLGVLSEVESDTRYLQASNNLSDISNLIAARDNLDVYSRGEAAGFFLDSGNNLSDLTSASIARTNIGVLSSTENDSRFVRQSHSPQIDWSSGGAQEWWLGAIGYSVADNLLYFALPTGWSASLVNSGSIRPYQIRITHNLPIGTRVTVQITPGSDFRLSRYTSGASTSFTNHGVGIQYASSTFFDINILETSTGVLRNSGNYNVEFQVFNFKQSEFSTGSMTP